MQVGGEGPVCSWTVGLSGEEQRERAGAVTGTGSWAARWREPL